MALDYKALDYEIENYSTAVNWNNKNSRAEIPILEDGDVNVVNSAHIIAYLEHRYPDKSLYPTDCAMRVKALKWERLSDTWADAIVTNIAIWEWANIGARPEGLMEASRLEINRLYQALEEDLESCTYICGSELSIGDIALYPQLSAAAFLQLPWDKKLHLNIEVWYKLMSRSKEVAKDNEAVMTWWKSRTETSVETSKINWGTYRLEIFMAMGFHEQLLKEIQEERVLWSVGPDKNW